MMRRPLFGRMTLPPLRRWWSEDTLGLVLIVALGAYSIFPPIDRTSDTRRKQDLDALQQAVAGYARGNGGSHQVVGAGWQGTGMGWLAERYDKPLSIVEILQAKGLLAATIADDPAQRPGYMIYVCDEGRRFAIFATLDHATRAEKAEARSRCHGQGAAVDVYGKNYAVGN